MAKTSTFETTYIRYPFAPLVALGVAIAAWFKTDFGGTNNAAGNGRSAGSKPEALGHAA